ncbi:MAG: methyltransferase domain-containing protein [Synechococcales cyanobacterium]
MNVWLTPAQRTKLDPSADTLFYDVPRFVTHVDEGFIRQLRDLYQQTLPAQGRILDLMSSWVSHLPAEMPFAHVEGHGLNAEELAANPRLDHYFVQDLNRDPYLPLADASFDAVLNTVSVQYLQQPEVVLAEIARILKPGGQVIISFSNRMFYHKAIQAWRDNSEAGRVALVKAYLAQTPDFVDIRVVQQAGVGMGGWLGRWLGEGGDPFYAVVGQKAGHQGPNPA